MKKTILVVLGLLLVAVGAVVFYVVSNLDSIVKNVIEEQGSKALGTSVRVSGVSISLADGSAEISGIRISNPGGFDSDYAMHLGRVAAGIDKESLTTDVIRITNIDVNDAHVIAEQKDARINLKELLDNIESGADAGDEDTAAADESGTRVVINRFVMTNPKMDLVGFGNEDSTVEMGDVRVNNIGDSSSGAGTSEIAKQLLTPVLAAAVRKAAQDAIKEKLTGEAGKIGERVTEKLGKLLGKDDDDDQED